jgi:hypothetical protein
MDESVDFYKIYQLSDRQINHNYKYLGEGISRRVYSLNDDYVIKLAKGSEGHYQNKVEHYVFTHVDSNILRYLCPIVWFNPRMIIMKKAVPLSKIIRDRHINLATIRPEQNAADDLRSMAFNFFLYYKDILATSSWGELSGANVLIDYGCTSRIGDIFYEMVFAAQR